MLPSVEDVLAVCRPASVQAALQHEIAFLGHMQHSHSTVTRWVIHQPCQHTLLLIIHVLCVFVCIY